jgi:hypothetical protein
MLRMPPREEEFENAIVSGESSGSMPEVGQFLL